MLIQKIEACPLRIPLEPGSSPSNAGTWGAQRANPFAWLAEIAQPVLVLNGSNDIIIPMAASTIDSRFHLCGFVRCSSSREPHLLQ